MTVVIDDSDVDVLGLWASGKTQRVRLFGRMVEAGLRFAFFGRVSTEDYQDPVSSRRWQFDLAIDCIAGRGRITAQFFDIGYSREIAWADRPEAARLLAAITDPDRRRPALGSAISPLLANLFMHYAFDAWMGREFPTVRFERYCDDVVVHCETQEQAQQVRDAIAARLAECGGLQLHPDKTRIV